jgi:hypothetical protein
LIVPEKRPLVRNPPGTLDMGSRLRLFGPVVVFCFLFLPYAVKAAQVPQGQARELAARFLSSQVPQFAGLHSDQLVLAIEAAEPAIGDVPAAVLYRVFNVGGNGFVIISGDDMVMPVLGYSTEGEFPAGSTPINVAKWLEGYKTEIRAAIAAGGSAAPAVHAEWVRWEQLHPVAQGGTRSVAPLLQTTWDQPAPYNALCPGGSVTGCVATAMAQVMKYHNWPQQGTGFHSYNEPHYGTLSANYAATTYDWASMPNSVTGPNTAVATLMYHCGVGVDMNYSPQVSGAWVIEANSQGTQNNAEYALKNYFNYSTDMQGLQRAGYSDAQWINMLKADLDASRPVIYDGFGSGGGHCFVADGYDDNNFFHFNWGWSGAYNGNFTISALNPDGQGTGGGTGSYNSGQEAIFGIQPAGGGGGGGGGQQTFEMGLYNYVTPSASTIYYGQAFSVSTNVINNGSNNFSGDYCAAVFDDNSNFYGFIQTLTGYTLQSGYVYNSDLVFSTTGLLTMLPGTYYIGILYRPTNGEWVLVSDNGGYTNFPQIDVVNPNDIELNAALNVSPGTTVTQGSQLSVSTNIVNDGSDTFYGQYGAALFNLDGSWAQDIGTINENNGLPGGYTYNNPFTLGPVTVTVAPGTYLLAVEHNPNNSGWQLTGSSYYANPIFVTVTAPVIQPDQYEVNNTVAQAFQAPVNFSGNSASWSSTGSNLHNPDDQDLYKVVLPSGYGYTVSARLHDSYNSGNGQTYTVDGMFSYSLDGNTWSAVYDDIMPNEIYLPNGGTVYFHVAPYFQGLTGTYLLQMDIDRGSVGINDLDVVSGIRVFPNPARDQVTVDLSSLPAKARRVELLDAQGRVVLVPATNPTSGELMNIRLEGIAEGPYVLRITTDAGIATERLIIAK